MLLGVWCVCGPGGLVGSKVGVETTDEPKEHSNHWQALMQNWIRDCECTCVMYRVNFGKFRTWTSTTLVSTFDKRAERTDSTWQSGKIFKWTFWTWSEGFNDIHQLVLILLNICLCCKIVFPKRMGQNLKSKYFDLGEENSSSYKQCRLQIIIIWQAPFKYLSQLWWIPIQYLQSTLAKCHGA
jgi:hypothetical protein